MTSVQGKNDPFRLYGSFAVFFFHETGYSRHTSAIVKAYFSTGALAQHAKLSKRVARMAREAEFKKNLIPAALKHWESLSQGEKERWITEVGPDIVPQPLLKNYVPAPDRMCLHSIRLTCVC